MDLKLLEVVPYIAMLVYISIALPNGFYWNFQPVALYMEISSYHTIYFVLGFLIQLFFVDFEWQRGRSLNFFNDFKYLLAIYTFSLGL